MIIEGPLYVLHIHQEDLIDEKAAAENIKNSTANYIVLYDPINLDMLKEHQPVLDELNQFVFVKGLMIFAPFKLY